MERQQRVIHFSGQVQGVGFRFTAKHLADSYRIAGYVRNLPDGRVEVVADGPRDVIDTFLADLHNRMIGRIREMVQEPRTHCRQYAGFSIRL